MEEGLLTREEAGTLISRLKFPMDPACFSDRDLIVESIAENLAIKQDYWEMISPMRRSPRS